jgi:hypothetical protein
VYSVSLCCLCVNVFCTTAIGISGHISTTLTEGFPCFFVICKVYKGITRKDGAQPALSNLFLLLRMFRSLYSVCVPMCTVLLPPGVNPTAVKN